MSEVRGSTGDYLRQGPLFVRTVTIDRNSGSVVVKLGDQTIEIVVYLSIPDRVTPDGDLVTDEAKLQEMIAYYTARNRYLKVTVEGVPT